MRALLVDFHFIAAVKGTGILEVVDLADILTLVSCFPLKINPPYSNTTTTKLTTSEPNQVRSCQSCSATATDTM